MRFYLLGIVLILSFSSWTSSTELHSTKSYSSVIYQDANGWNLKMSFSSSGLREGMRSYFKDKELLLGYDEPSKLKIIKYLKEHIDIKVNKQFEANLVGYQATITDHASEIRFKLGNLPTNAFYWDIKINACKENVHGAENVMAIKKGSKSTIIKLTDKNHFQTKVGRDSTGEFRKITSRI